MKKSHPRAEPQTWANKDHLAKILHEQGPEAAEQEFLRMQDGHLPPVTSAHRGAAAAYRRWNNLPALDADVSAEQSAPQRKAV